MSPRPTPADGAILDDFTDPRSGWPVSDDTDGSEAAYVDGAYEMAVDSWKMALSPAPGEVDTPGVVVRVNAKRLEDHPGQTGGGWGLVCGDAVDEERYYQAFVQVSSGVGRPGLFRWEDGDVEAYRKLADHDAVKPDGVNRLELRCSAEAGQQTVVFVINGEEIARGVHGGRPQIEQWETGLMLDGSPLPSGEQLRMRFDDYEVAPAP